MSKVKISLVTGLIVIVLIGLIGFRLKQKNENQAGLKKPKNQKIPVTVIKAKKETFYNYIVASGTITPTDEINLTSKVSARINELNINEGDTIKQGQVIGSLDHSELDIQIEQIKAQVKIAQASLNMSVNGAVKPQLEQAKSNIKQLEFNLKERESNLKELEINKLNAENEFNAQQNLLIKGISSKQQVDTFKTRLDSIKQQIETAKQQIGASKQQIETSKQSLKLLSDGTRPEQIDLNKAQLENSLSLLKLYQSQLSDYKIVSPLDGVVTKKYLGVGSLANPSNPIITISKDKDFDIILDIPEKEIENVKLSQKVTIKTTSNSNREYEGFITEIYPNIDTKTRLGKVKAKLLDKENNLKLGMLLICNIYTVKKGHTIILPSEAVIKDGKNSFVYILHKDKALKKDVKIGIEEPEKTEIILGVNNGDSVILKGNAFVSDNASVEIQPEFKKLKK